MSRGVCVYETAFSDGLIRYLIEMYHSLISPANRSPDIWLLLHQDQQLFNLIFSPFQKFINVFNVFVLIFPLAENPYVLIYK